MKAYDRSVLADLIGRMEDIAAAERNDGDEWGLDRAEWLLELARFLDRRLEELFAQAGAEAFDDGPLLDWDAAAELNPFDGGSVEALPK